MGQSAIVRPLKQARPAAPLPVGTVTFLLADLEGSVRLWESDRAAMTRAVARLDAMHGEEIARHHGVRPVEQGEGDSFVAAFASADDALRCAISIQQAMVDETWPGDLVLRTRMALHTGEAQLRDEGNYVGNAINRAGRLRSLAHGGQILVSPTTFELVADNLPEATSLRDLGLQRIRDLGRPLRVHQVAHPTLDDSFPPLRSLEVLTAHLPVSLSTFIGRERELQDITDQLSGARLLTLTGAGGCGKTRLALEAARATAELYADGVRFADLSQVTTGGDVARTVADAFDRHQQADRDILETLVEHLRSRRALLLLDNCEHVLSACADIARRLLQTCPGLTILATSREPLRLDVEVPWRVPSMSMPGRGAADALGTSDAVRLFIDRAVHARPNFTVTNDNAPAVTAICQELDGIPLAVELAAARVRVISVEQIAAGLSDRFHLLRGGARGDLPRQQTLEASVGWSHDLLTERERILLRRAAVFASGFTLDAAEAVCSGEGIDTYDVLDLLAGLVDKSLVTMEEQGAAARYRLLETIRQFARRQLDAAGETSATRERHGRWFAEFALGATPHLVGPDQASWFRRLEEDHDNLRSALDWAVSAPAPDVGMTMAAALGWFWNVHGHWQEGVSWIHKIRATAPAADDLTDLLDLLGPALGGMVGNAKAAIPAAEAAAERYQLTGNHKQRAMALDVLGKYTGGLDGSKARDYLVESVAEARLAGDGSILVDSLASAAWADLGAGDTATAMARAQEAQAEATLTGDIRGQLVALHPLAAVAIRRGDLPLAHSLLDHALELAADVGDRFWLAIGHLLSGHVELLRGEHERAKELFGEGVELGKETGSSFLAAASSFLAGGALAAGDPHRALEIDGDRRWDNQSENWLHFLSPTPTLRAEAFLAVGDLAAARESAEATWQLAVDTNQRFLAAQAQLARTRVAVAEAIPVAAETLAHDALVVFREAEAFNESVQTVELLAACSVATEKVREAASVNTVRTHLVHVFAKVGVTTRSELAAQATSRNL